LSYKCSRKHTKDTPLTLVSAGSSLANMTKEFEQTLSHPEGAQETRRRSSIAASLAGGFQAVNVVKPLPTVTQAHEPQSGSTTFASKDLIAYYRPGDHWEGKASHSQGRIHNACRARKVKTLTCGLDRLANLHLCLSHVLRTSA
jgi:hypothetical protein